MTITVTHAKVSTVPDGVDTSLVRPSDWNAEHVVTGSVPGIVTEALMLACTSETIPFNATTGIIHFRMPYAFTVTGVRASLTTAQTSGSVVTVDINESGSSILSTKLRFDNGEKTTTTGTPAVVSDASLADDAEITIDIDQIGDGTATGLKVLILGNQT